jgi:RNA polymerase sigma factor (sigma-70 family)
MPMSWEKLRRSAFIAARKLGANGVDADDFANEAMLAWLEGHWRGQTVNQAVISAYRKIYGRGKARMTYVELDHDEPRESQAHGFDYNAWVSELEERDRAMIKLKYEWGMEGIEIADLFGISKSRVSQRLKILEGKMKERMERDQW